MLGILFSFVSKKPKLAIAAGIGFALFLFYVHYTLLVNERDKLRVAEAGYKLAVSAFVQREETLHEDIRLEREAARIATQERDAARESIDTFREGRIDDESIEWAQDSIPLDEVHRFCIALPEMTGCQSIQHQN